MAKTLEQLLSLSSIIANETKAGANTALRVGGLFSDIIYYLRDLDYADKDDIPSLEGYATEQWVLGKGYATTSDLDTRIDALVNGAPAAYDTLKEIADVLAGNVNSISDILTALGNKADKATTLSGYGITDAYTITQIDSIVNGLSGNISTLQGYFTDGVANSATKLATARTIWGQSFDGTGNVGGNLHLDNSKIYWHSDSANYYIDNYYDGTNSPLMRYMGYSGHRFMTSSGEIMRITSSGNVGIGTTSPQYKLDVNGTTRTTKLVIGNGSIEWDETNKGFKIVGGLYTESYLSAKGANTNGGSSSGGGLITSLYRYADLGKTFADTSNDTFNAYTINKINADLGSRISVLEGKATNVSFTQSLTSGTQIGTITIDGASKNIYAPTIPTDDINKGVTAYGWGNHANVGYAMASALGDYQTKITSSNKLDYSLISGVPTKLSQFTNDLGLGTFAYKSSLAFADLTNKPTTISGYGITDAYTKSQVDSALGGYLPLSGGTISGNLIVQTHTVTGMLYPSADDIYVLGLGTRRWRDLYTTLINGYTPIHSGNIGSQSVASAAKLTTARKIWGQSFDGTEDVTGTLHITTHSINTDYSEGIRINALNGGYSSIWLNTTNAYGYDVGMWGITAMSSGNLRFRGGSTSLNDLMVITKSGNVGIGTASPQYKLDVNGIIHSSTGIFSDGYVSAKGQNTSSDMRLKNVLNEVVLGVNDIANAPSMRFSWKNGGGVDVGSSAQYWQGLLPDAVKERDGMLEMQYANIALLSAIAIAKNVETHEERIARLEKENKELRNEIMILKGGNYA